MRPADKKSPPKLNHTKKKAMHRIQHQRILPVKSFHALVCLLLLQSCCKQEVEWDNYCIEGVYYGVSPVPGDTSYSKTIVNKDGKIQLHEEIYKTESGKIKKNIIYAEDKRNRQ